MSRIVVPFLFFFIAATLAESAQAQSVFDRARRAAERTVEREVEERAERAGTAAGTAVVDTVEQAVVCAVSDERCIRRARGGNRELVIVDGEGNTVAHENAPAGTRAAGGGASGGVVAPGEGVWANYDFVPGDRVLFTDDFSGDRVGNFPRRLEFVSGTMEIVQLDGSRYLRATSDSQFELVLPEALPERFTIEFEAHLPHWWHQLYLAMGEPDGGYSSARAAYHRLDRYPFSYVQLSKQFQSGLSGDGGGTALTRYEPLHEGIVPVRIMADGRYIKVFLNERRIVNVPNANLRRSNRLAIFITGEVSEARPVFIGNFRIAAGGPSLYDALQADGRATTQGILFDVGSAELRPESTPTLEDIVDALRRDASLRLRIEGHTDNVGDAAVNQRLSEQRAQSVVQYLVQRKGVDAGRLEAVGFGQERPAADNGSPEGRQTNRRIDLVVLVPGRAQ